MTAKDKPTKKFYGLFQYIFDHYNGHLFESKIKDPIIVITRRKNVAGYYIHESFYHIEDNETDELALNPEMFLKFPLIEICQTIVHEMCHAWQHHYGSPSYRAYHNKEWAEKMIEVGLMPSDTGKPGGKTTGFHMADYPIKGGRFLQVSEELMNNEVFEGLYYENNPSLFQNIDNSLPLYDQIKDLVLEELTTPKPKPKKSKIKYSCGCSNVWGKPDLEIHCNACGEDMRPAS
jgi:hypothetical protein|tara:strand:- start:2572 stop:3270 length:699 start_codon:yes stop_codon:yes gene_type:complete